MSAMTEQLAAAEQAAAEPRRRLAELEAEMQAAIGRGQFDLAHQLQSQIEPAREAAAVADAQVGAFRAAADALGQRQAAAAQELADAQARAQAERDLAAAGQDEQQAADRMRASVDDMWAALRTAQQHFRAAVGHEADAAAAGARAIAARGARGDWPAGHPGPTPRRPTGQQALRDQSPLVRELMAWPGR